ncbi:fructan beta-fructosidase [Chryseolinea serpens]|uniref:Fructan beta-fructosidase n=1 Tax=Chryseolinea serpens TaxID=947013 RepID=A0A1M5U6S6_9BACT|nr:glycoside hydrolase family 32 protein [Chryseolinea serpens]SHH58413.1 fructan beta-fructosidase [Chryseolinea serpens]
MTKTLYLLLPLALLFSCKQKPSPETTAKETAPVPYEEKYRPQYHFSPDHNWTNDPNGLIFYKGEYHLFYQYNPYGNTWGHMSWGHAVSKDLLHWQHVPVAIDEYANAGGADSTMIFSGSAVADDQNTSGFFPKDSGGIVSIYTSHVHSRGQQLRQHQSVAYSSDLGRTFTRYEHNPVLDIGLKDFRDPKVMWYAPEKKWVMTVVIPDQFKAQFYTSKNLRDWTLLSTFGPLGDTAKIWECPDLVQVPDVADPSKKKWVLLISNSHPQGPKYVGMQYFVGNFDGKKFTPDHPSQYPLYLEYGKDFYAAVTFSNLPAADGRTILLGWANNWAYGNHIPTSPWRSAMTLPRELYVANTPKGYRILQRPVRELANLRGDSIAFDSAGETTLDKASVIDYAFNGGSATGFGLTLHTGPNEETRIGYDKTKGEVFVDRAHSGPVFDAGFPSIERAPVSLQDGKLKLQIYVDHSIVEVYVNDGEQVITDQIFPTGDYVLKTWSEGGDAAVDVRLWKMRSVWK